LNIIPGISDIVTNRRQHTESSDYYTSFAQFFDPLVIF